LIVHRFAVYLVEFDAGLFAAFTELLGAFVVAFPVFPAAVPPVAGAG
jgi:hypothetical protein